MQSLNIRPCPLVFSWIYWYCRSERHVILILKNLASCTNYHNQVTEYFQISQWQIQDFLGGAQPLRKCQKFFSKTAWNWKHFTPPQVPPTASHGFWKMKFPHNHHNLDLFQLICFHQISTLANSTFLIHRSFQKITITLGGKITFLGSSLHLGKPYGSKLHR